MDQTNPELNEVKNRQLGTEEEIITRLDNAYHRNWNTAHIREKIKSILEGKSRDIQQDRARAFVLYLEVLSLREDKELKFKLSDIHRCLQWYKVSKPRIKSYKKFEEFINRGAGKTERTLLDFLKDKPRGIGNKKVSDTLVIWIKKFYTDPRKLNLETITNLINHAIRLEVKEEGIDSAIIKFDLPDTQKVRDKLQSALNFMSTSNVKKLLTNQIRNESLRLRYGNKEARQVLTRPLHRLPAQFPLDRVEIDSTVFTYPHYDEKGKVTTKLVTCIVMDTYSGRIIGCAFDKSENSDLYLRAIRSAFSGFGKLPREIFCDQFPGNNNHQLEEFKNYIKRLGCLFSVEKTGNPRAKGGVEKAIDLLCEIMKKDDNYFGKNITTTSKESRKSIEHIQKMLRVDNIKGIGEVKSQIITAISELNSTTKKGETINRFQKFKSAKPKNAIDLQLEDQIWLWNKAGIYQVENGGLIIFKRRFELYYYEITDFDIRLKYTGENVIVKFNEEELRSGGDIYLFDTTTQELICTCKPQRRSHIAKANQNEEDLTIIRDSIADKKAFNKHIKEKERIILEPEIGIVNYLTSAKVEMMEAEDLYEMRQKAEVRHNGEIYAIKLEEDQAVLVGNVFPHENQKRRVQKQHDKFISDCDRLAGFDKDEMIGGSDELEIIPIMNVDKS